MFKVIVAETGGRHMPSSATIQPLNFIVVMVLVIGIRGNVILENSKTTGAITGPELMSFNFCTLFEWRDSCRLGASLFFRASDVRSKMASVITICAHTTHSRKQR